MVEKNLQKSTKNLQENEFVVIGNFLHTKLKNTLSSAIPEFRFSVKGKENVNIMKITFFTLIFYIFCHDFMIFTNSYHDFYKFFIFFHDKNSFFHENYKFLGFFHE